MTWERRPGLWLRDPPGSLYAAVWLMSPDGEWAWEVSDDALPFPQCGVDFGKEASRDAAMAAADAALRALGVDPAADL